MSRIEVILVDTHDRPIGTMEKLEVHQKGLLHRAVTVYIFNRQGELLMQKRAANKYHCGGLWSNTCCGHPYPGEMTQQAAERRLHEEMGMHVVLTPMFETRYKLSLNNGLTEHEYGHIFFGVSDELPVLNPDEAEDMCYMPLALLLTNIQQQPESYTPWFRETCGSVPEYLPAFQEHAL